MPKMLSPSEIEKLPHCRYDFFGKCDKEVKFSIQKEVSIKECVACMCELIFKGASQDNCSLAMHGLDMLLIVLKELDVLPKEAKP